MAPYPLPISTADALPRPRGLAIGSHSRSCPPPAPDSAAACLHSTARRHQTSPKSLNRRATDVRCRDCDRQHAVVPGRRGCRGSGQAQRSRMVIVRDEKDVKQVTKHVRNATCSPGPSHIIRLRAVPFCRRPDVASCLRGMEDAGLLPHERRPERAGSRSAAMRRAIAVDWPLGKRRPCAIAESDGAKRDASGDPRERRATVRVRRRRTRFHRTRTSYRSETSPLRHSPTHRSTCPFHGRRARARSARRPGTIRWRHGCPPGAPGTPGRS